MPKSTDFPFSIFFEALSANGIKVTLADYGRVCRALSANDKWTIEKLRGVLQALLVKNQEEEKRFRSCFDSFFAEHLPEYSEGDGNFLNISDSPAASSASRNERRKYYFKSIDYIALAIVAFAVIILAVSLIVRPEQQMTTEGNQKNAAPTNTSTASPTPTKTPQQPPIYLNLLLLLRTVAIWFGLIGVLYGIVRMIQFWRSASPSPPPSPLATGPRIFSLRTIDGEPLHLLSESALDQISSSLRYAISGHHSKRLDIKASVTASGRQAGLLSLVYEQARIVRNVYIVVDAYASSLKWNPTAKELALGLARRGIQVSFGEFYGKPDRFRMEDGDLIYLEDLEDIRSSSFLLIFSDAKQLEFPRDRRTFEILKQFPMAAWFDLREPMFWDESARLIRDLKIPLFHASETGILRAMEYFVSEQGHLYIREDTERMWTGVPPFVSGDLDSYLEILLGDALPWAQACSMMQPLPLNLANALRARFQSHLPPGRIECLFLLPGTWSDASGIQFSRSVLASLRSGFSVRWDESEQIEILQFIINAIKSAEPAEKESLRHLSWEWTLERVRLELNPDEALQRLVPLLDTPIGPHVRAELSYLLIDPEDSTSKGNERVPLRVNPKTALGQMLVSRLNSAVNQVHGKEGEHYLKEWGKRMSSYLPIRLAIGFIRGLLEFLALLYELFAYFPYYQGQRDASGFYIKPRSREP
jgi:hypothetical protein